MPTLPSHIVLCIYFSCRDVQLILGAACTDGCVHIVIVYGLLLLIIENITLTLLKNIVFFTQIYIVTTLLRRWDVFLYYKTSGA